MPGTGSCKSRWVSLMILLGRFAISPLDLAANPVNHPPTPQHLFSLLRSVIKLGK